MAIKKGGKVPTKTWLPFDVGFSERLDLFGVEVSTSDGKIVEFLAGGQFCDTFDSVAHLKAVFLTSGLSGHLLLAALLRLFYYGVRPRVIRVGQPFTVFCHGIWYAPDIKKIILLIGLSESDPGFAISESIINKAKEFVVNHQAAVREWENKGAEIRASRESSPKEVREILDKFPDAHFFHRPTLSADILIPYIPTCIFVESRSKRIDSLIEITQKAVSNSGGCPDFCVNGFLFNAAASGP